VQPLRIGLGYDVHRFESGRKLVLGGVEIPHAKGLAGHSDADAVCHAVTDAILGAAGLGSIGTHFPNSDPRYKDAASTLFLKQAYALAQEAGFTLGNVDVVVLAEAPKLMPYAKAMAHTLAEVMGVEPSAVHIKATSYEGLGPIGRGEGLAAQAVCILYKA
jgi:2-C-methyl-D-erythritol 2,4-cyclodiphosphate synthase